MRLRQATLSCYFVLSAGSAFFHSSMNTIPVVVNASSADDLLLSYARFSLPLKRGEYWKAPDVELTDSSGAHFPAQAEELTRWPDGSLRMIHLCVAARGGDYRTNLADGDGLQSPPKLQVQAHGDTVEVENGNLRALLGGPALIRSVKCGGQEYFDDSALNIEVEDGQGRTFTARKFHEVKAEVETCGSLRAVVALHGKCSDGGTNFLDFRIRFEFLAGVEGFSLSYCFFNRERGVDFFDVNAISLSLQMAHVAQPEYSVCQINHGIFGDAHIATTRQALHIAVDDSRVRPHVENFEALGDGTDYPFYLENGKTDVQNWAALSDGARCIVVEMDDFHLLRPKNLLLEDGMARFGIWPREAGVLDLQQGRSREVTVRVAVTLAGAPQSHGDAAARIAQLRDVWRAQLPHEVYAAAQFFDQSRVLSFDPNKHPRFEGWLDKMASGLHSVARFFDLGDSTDSGYRSTYTPLGRQRRVRGEDGGARWFSSGYGHPALAMNDLEDFEPVWVNNEYDVLFAIGTEYLRTGDLTLLQKLKWFARHTIEVDFLHHSDHKWLHRAQPAHSARHTTTGAYPSHFWTQGLAQYYMLTGDPDALEIIIALADKTIENLDDPILSQRTSGLNREVGWGVLSLVCAYEASGDQLYDDYARRILDGIIAEGLPHDLPNFSFGHTSMLLAARQFLQVHEGEGDEYFDVVRSWFLSWVDLAIECSREAPRTKNDKTVKFGAYDYTVRAAARGGMWAQSARRGIFESHSLALDSLAYAHEISGDLKYIVAGLRSLEVLLESPRFQSPTAEGKPFAMSHRTWINFLQGAAKTDLLEQWEYRY